MIETVFQKIGLNQTEIKVYKALLELGESKTGEILNKAKLNSGRIYEILASLQNKGLISFIIRDKVKYFSPSDPSKVLDYLKEKKHSIEDQEKAYKEILPNLMKKINNSKKASKVEIYTGLKGLESAYKKELTFCSKDSTVYVFGIMDTENYSKEYLDFFKYNIYPKREKLKVKIKKIFSKDVKTLRKDQEKGAEIKYLPYASPVTINVIENLTTIGITGEELLFISIESEEIAKSFIQQFEFMWKIAKA